MYFKILDYIETFLFYLTQLMNSRIKNDMPHNR